MVVRQLLGTYLQYLHTMGRYFWPNRLLQWKSDSWNKAGTKRPSGRASKFIKLMFGWLSLCRPSPGAASRSTPLLRLVCHIPWQLIIIQMARLCTPFLFPFRPGLSVWNPQVSADNFRFHGTQVGIKSFRSKIKCCGILPMNLKSGRNPDRATCNKHTAGSDRLKKTQKKQVSVMAFCCYMALPQTATPCCHAGVLPPLLPLLEQRRL